MRTSADEPHTEVPASLNLYDGLIYVDGAKEPVLGVKICPDCQGRRTTPGDWVPYGSGNVQLPDEPCETCAGTGLDPKSVRVLLVDAFEQGVEFALQRYGISPGSLALRNDVEEEIATRFSSDS